MNYQFGIAILYVRDLETAKRFYTEKLGLSIVEAQSGPTFVILGMSGGALLALQDAATEKATTPGPAGGTLIGLVVDDVDAVWRALQSKGVRMLNQPTDLPFGRAFDLLDPEGHHLNIYKPPTR